MTTESVTWISKVGYHKNCAYHVQWSNGSDHA